MDGLSRRGRAGAQTRRVLFALVVCASARLPVCAFAQSDDGIQRIARELEPTVEQAVGLTFKRPPVIATRSPQQVRAFLDRKIAEELPPAEIAAVQRTYRAFHLIPDTLDLRRTMVDLYAEQVAGFYDPDSSALFVVRGGDPAMVRVVLAHELVHALQDQYTHLNAILKLKRHNDRQMAGQAVMEGQATVASISALAPGQVIDFAVAWGAIREGLRQQQSSMPVFAGAPHFIQESLLFPYLAGGEFVQSFDATRATPGEQPYNERLPISTTQVLHPVKYARHAVPLMLAITAAPGDTLIYRDDFGEFETRTALESWGVAGDEAAAAAAGWDGDQYQVLGTRAGTVIVWASAWDTPADASEFERVVKSGWAKVAVAGRRWQVDRLTVGRASVVRLTDAPASWSGWTRLPAVRVASGG